MVRYNPVMAWLWAVLPVAIVMGTSLATKNIHAAIVGYHLLCVIAVLSRFRKVKPLFTWS